MQPGLSAIETLRLHRHAQDLRDTWEGRALAHARGQMGAIVLSVLAHNYGDECLLVLLKVVFAGFVGVKAPFYCSAARIMHSGQVAADLITKTGQLVKRAEVFKDETAMQSAFRRLADELKLNDADREAMFAAVKSWVVCDFRLDPLMDPKDPDAKRLH